MTKHTKPGSGGKRPGSGQPKKEETSMITIRIPLKLKLKLKSKYKRKLNGIIRDFLKTLER